ncbi:MAG: hypothetical protein KatS3mg113_0270 [Planctomycetaceae bacterium]|nr:MAG: hypothetical protein KatS3mg113_0270 [Planctomycetaceae bacterium]
MIELANSLFLWAGLLAAGIPVWVHLRQRHRPRELWWGAMQFLEEVLRRRQRWWRLRDVLLLLLRIMSLGALGMMFARPFVSQQLNSWGVWSITAILILGWGLLGSAPAAVGRWRWGMAALGLICVLLSGSMLYRPLGVRGSERPAQQGYGQHGLVLDNTLSMATRDLTGTRWEACLRRARQILEQAPDDSRWFLQPLVNVEGTLPESALPPREALSWLDKIPLTHATSTLSEMHLQLNAQDLHGTSIDSLSIISDFQQTQWSAVAWEQIQKKTPQVRLFPCAADDRGNVWVSELNVENGVAFSQTTSLITARLHTRGIHEPVDVRITLQIDTQPVAVQTVRLEPAQDRLLEFHHTFVMPQHDNQAQPQLVTLKIECFQPEHDHLVEDNSMAVLVPVFPRFPILFVDQLGSAENVGQQRLGETYVLRKLLIPEPTRSDPWASTEVPRALRPEELTHEKLNEARLVMVAGVASLSPETHQLLLTFVEQGGAVVILAGGDFDPAQWQASCWNDGQGLLPVPVKTEPWGRTPSEQHLPQPFFVDTAELWHDFFVLPGEDRQLIPEVFRATPFFKAVEVDIASVSAGLIRPRQSTARGDTNRSSAPQILAWFQQPQIPWVVTCRRGSGQVVFFTSGVTSDWNLLRSSAALYVFPRVVFGLLRSPWEAFNAACGQRVVTPWKLPGHWRFRWQPPSGQGRPLHPVALDAQTTGLLVRDTWHQGVYRLEAWQLRHDPQASSPEPAADLVLRWAIRAPAQESDLTPLDMTQTFPIGVQVIAPAETFDAALLTHSGQELWQRWWWCLWWCCWGELLFLGLMRRTRLHQKQA